MALILGVVTTIAVRRTAFSDEGARGRDMSVRALGVATRRRAGAASRASYASL